MRRSGRQDVTLLVGLAIAALVTFQGPIQHFLLVGRQIDEQEVLALVPELAILLTVLLGNHLMARQDRVAQRYYDAQAHSALSLSHALSHATSRETVRDVLRHTGCLPSPEPTGCGSSSSRAASGDSWWVRRSPFRRECRRRSKPWRQGLRMASSVSFEEPHGVRVDSYLCFRFIVGDNVAVLGSPLDAFPG